MSIETNLVAEINEKDPNNLDQHLPGAKLDKNKLNIYSLFIQYFPDAIKEVTKVSIYGANKYTPFGWKKVTNGFTRYTDALLRHLLEETKETIDPETNLLHAAQVAWNALARLQLLVEHNTLLNTTVSSFSVVDPNYRERLIKELL